MNYLSHAYRFLDDPYFVAGTALPDWMSVVDRKNRPRRQYAEPVQSHENNSIATMAKGVMQHHADDHWFHQQEKFVELSTLFAVELREVIGANQGHQAGFLGHIIVELLLDSVLIERDSELLDRYYDVLKSLDGELVQQGASQICPRPVQHLNILLQRFIDERFLADYVDDEGMLYRLNGVMRRVKLPKLNDEVLGWIEAVRPRVRSSADGLLPQR